MALSRLLGAASSPQHVLFLTAETSEEGNKKVLQDPVASELQRKDMRVSARSMLDWDRPLHLQDYSHIVLLRAWDYNLHLDQFHSIISDMQDLAGGIRISNPLPVVLWNIDKSKYLPELQTAGIRVIETTYLPLPAPAKTINHVLELRRSENAVVLKPSISASSFSTYLIKNPQDLNGEDEKAVGSFTNVNGLDKEAKLMIQDYMPEIETAGELSIMMVDGEITHAVRKTPQKGDFRSQAELGGSEVFLEAEEVDKDASIISQKIWRHVEKKFGCSGDNGLLYARIDGVVRDDGTFVLMEAEFIEPWMYMAGPHAKKGLERLCDRILS